MDKSREGFVKSEYDAGFAPSAPCESKTAEEINLVRKIELRTRNLIQAINALESLTNGLNKNLLPQIPKSESENKAVQRPPDGWLECHLTDLNHIQLRYGQIYEQVTRLVQATRTKKVGQ